MEMVITERLRGILQEQEPWLYVDDSPESQEILKEVEPFSRVGLVFVSDLTRDGGFSDVSLPRLLYKGDVIAGRQIRKYIQFLKELNSQFLRDE